MIAIITRMPDGGIVNVTYVTTENTLEEVEARWKDDNCVEVVEVEDYLD